MTPEQQRAIAIAKARKRKAEASNTPDEKVSAARTVFDQGLQGATFGFADELTDRMGAGIAALATDVPYEDLLKEARSSTKELQEKQFEQRPLLSIGANIAGGLLTGGAGATTKAGSQIANSVRTGNAGLRIGKAGGLGAVSGASYGAGTAEDGNRAEGALVGGILGGVTGGAVPAVGAASSGLKNALIPNIDEAIKPLAKRARDLGIPLRAEQVSPSRARNTVQKISQILPFSGTDIFEQKQAKAFTKAVAMTIGESAEDLGPETIKKFKTRNGEVFESVLGNREISVDLDDVSKIARLRNSVDDTLGLTDRDAKILKKEIAAISEQLGEGKLKGKKLASIRSDIIKKSANSKSGSPVFGRLIDQIDEIANKSVTKEGAKKLQQARKEYRNFKTIEPLLEKSNDGLINPTQLANRVKANKFISSADKAIGEDDLIDLARIGQMLPKQGGSDTFDKSVFGLSGRDLLTGGAIGLATDMGLTVGTLGANHALQKGIFSNQKLIDAAIKRPASKVLLPKAGTLGVLSGNAPNTLLQ